jgi:hypothetical protein
MHHDGPVDRRPTGTVHETFGRAARRASSRTGQKKVAQKYRLVRAEARDSGRFRWGANVHPAEERNRKGTSEVYINGSGPNATERAFGSFTMKVCGPP